VQRRDILHHVRRLRAHDRSSVLPQPRSVGHNRRAPVTPVWVQKWNPPHTSQIRQKPGRPRPRCDCAQRRIVPSEPWITGVDGSSAVLISVTASSSSYSTATCSAASSAAARLVATIAAVASPSSRRDRSRWRFAGRISGPSDAKHADPWRDDAASSRPVTTVNTPACVLPLRIDPVIAACACGEAGSHMRHARQLDVADIEPSPCTADQGSVAVPSCDIGVRAVEHRKRIRFVGRDVMARAPATCAVASTASTMAW